MKKRVSTCVMGCVILCVLSVHSGVARPGFRGPLPQEQRAFIGYMADHHDEFIRTVELIPNGYIATTTSENEELVATLKKHLAYMEKRLDSGSMVRRWDPAYAEMVNHYADLKTEIIELENGIRVTVLGMTPEAIEVARNHARIVTDFTKNGREAVARKHPSVIP